MESRTGIRGESKIDFHAVFPYGNVNAQCSTLNFQYSDKKKTALTAGPPIDNRPSKIKNQVPQKLLLPF
jgi:hypothetical protein